MFRHILVPTDGSALSQETSRQAVTFAKHVGARITAYYAKPDMTSAFGFYDAGGKTGATTLQQIEQLIDDEAQKNLIFVEQLCREAGVTCDTLATESDSPYESILETAKQSGADLIFMASHGRKGLKARLIGSETIKVLTHSQIPVLVYRWGDDPAAIDAIAENR